MYVASVPNRNSPPAILLRESFRLSGKVHKRTLANLSHWDPARVLALQRALRGDFDHLDSFPTCGPVFGLLFVLKQIADALGLTSALGKSRLAKLALFLVLARVAHHGSRLSAVRWAEDHAVAEVLHLGPFDEDDLYAALDDLCTRQQIVEKTLYQRYLQRRSVPPALFLYDVTSSYLEGEHNALGEYGYNRDGKRGKLQVVIGLLADEQGEPLAVRVFAGNTGDPATVAEQIRIVKEQFGVQELVFVGDRGMVKSKGKQALQEEGLRYISALTDPQIRKLLSTGTLQMSLFAEQVCEVEAGGVRYVLRKNEAQAAHEQHRWDDKLAKLSGMDLRVEGRTILLERKQAAIDQAMQLAGCYAVVTDVPKERMNEQAVHDTYVSLQKVERDFRLMKTGLLEVRPLFVRKESRTRGHVFCCMLALKLSREMERRLREHFGTTDSNPHAITLRDALTSLGTLCLLQYKIDEKTTVTKLPQPSANQTRILTALGMTLPAKM